MQLYTVHSSTAFGCADSTEISIGAQVGGLYYIPNAFTPDGDPFNPTFRPLFPVGFDPYNYNMLIYNRWGELVFETDQDNVGWDGKYQGEYVQEGLYIWKLFYNTANGPYIKKNNAFGQILLIK